MMNKRGQGTLFENYALEIYEKRGYSLLEKNYFSKYGEIDLILKKENLIVFAEVKQRTTDVFGSGEYAVDFRKRKRMFLSAQEFISEKGLEEQDIRFDAVIFGRDKKSWKVIKDIIWGDEFEF